MPLLPRSILLAARLSPVIAALSWPAWAAAEEDWFQPAALGMGGAVRVLGSDTSAVHLNASAMPANAGYYASVSYSFYGRERSHLLSTAGYDARTSAFALGTMYAMRVYEPPFVPSQDMPWYPAGRDAGEERLKDTRTLHRWDVSAAYGFLQRRLSLGLTARVLRQQAEIRSDWTKFTMDGGLTIWITQMLAASVVAENFVPTKDDRFPIRLAAGVGFRLLPFLQAEVDVVWDFTSLDHVATDLRGGVEVLIANVIAVRGGYYSDRRFIDHYICWGIGLQSPRVHIDFGMRIEAGPMEKRLKLGVPEANNRFWNGIGMKFLF